MTKNDQFSVQLNQNLCQILQKIADLAEKFGLTEH